MRDEHSRPFRRTVHAFVLAGVGICILPVLLPLPTELAPHPLVHSALEAASAMTGFCLGVLLLADPFPSTARRGSHVLMATAFLGMSILDAVHAVVPPGNAFVWLHGLAVAFGGLFFMLAVSPPVCRRISSPRAVVLPACLAASAIAGIALLRPAAVPAMLSESGFTGIAFVLNLVAGLAFVVPCVVFVGKHRKDGDLRNLLLAVFCGLHVTSGLLFLRADLWNPEWWLHHVLRALAFVAIFAEIVRSTRDHTIRLRRSEALFESLVRESPVPMAMVDEAGAFDLLSHRFVKTFGYDRGDLSSVEDWWNRAYPDEAYRRRVVEAWGEAVEAAEASEGLIAAGEYEIVCKDGSRRTVEISGVLLRGRTLASFVDLTARREAERALREEGLKVRNFLENTTDLVTVVNAEGAFEYVNAAAQDFLGIAPEDAPGRLAFDFVHPDDREATEAAFSRWIAEGVEHASFENRQVAANGGIRHCLWTVIPRYVDGRLEAVWSMARDITEHREAQARLAALNEDLHRSNAELERFAYVASHDLQEPLRMVASFTQLLARRYRDVLDETARSYIDYAVDGAKRMQELINDLLALSRVGTRGKPFEKVPLDDVLERIRRDLAPLIDESGAELVADPLPAVRGDPSQIEQILRNLVSNAIKFRSDAPPRIEIRAVPAGDRWEISVRDNGIGIAGKFHERIFVMFQRLHNRVEYSGNGIGLAIVKKIVERHGGTVRVESEEGRGARFLFTLPASDAT